MKENWTYKKLGEVGEIITGNTPSTKDEENYSSNDYCFVKPSDICVDRISKIVETEFHVSKTGFQHSRQLPQGTVLTTCIGIIGKVGILQKEATCNQQINAIVPSSIVSSEYLAYAIFGLRSELELMANAPVVPIINKGSFSNFTIPVPPIETQSRIVSELDLLQSIIDKQQAQLKELDKLAQTVFYDMFGDPMENEKGWEVKKLEGVVAENCPISYGIVQPGEGVANGVPVVRPVDMTNTFVFRFGLKQTTKEISDSYRRTILKGNEILLCVRGTTGLVALASEELVGCNVTRGVAPIECNEHNDRWFVYNQFLTKGIQQYIADYTKGIALKQINMKDVREIPLIVPPLSLQQSFAAKIESIEKQKSAISQSIAETQKLFNYTMDKYFG